MEKTKPKIEIPVLAAGSSLSSSSEPRKISKEVTIQAIEAKLKSLETSKNDFEINKTIVNEMPMIYKYQYNKISSENGQQRQTNKTFRQNPYKKRHRK